MRRLHGLLWYLAEALARPEAAPLYVEARALQWRRSGSHGPRPTS